MKRCLSLLIGLALLLSLCTRAGASYDPGADYLSILLRAVRCGDFDAGRAAELCYAELLDDLGSTAPRLRFEELWLLSKLITWEAGTERLGLEWRLRVGEVALNRVASPEFPDTLREVIYQPGQYAGVETEEFEYLLDPTESSVVAAWRLLSGERHMAPSVVYQANFEQGSGVYAAYYDRVYGFTYFCESARPELYAEEEDA